MKSWSETLLVVGAGATADLGMPQSDSQSKILRALADADCVDSPSIWGKYSLESVLSNNGPEKIFGRTPSFEGRNLEIMVAFLKFLGNNTDRTWTEIVDDDIVNARVVYGSHVRIETLKSRILELRREYDWNALKQIIQICPYNKNQDNLVRDLFTIVDQKIAARQGIKVIKGFIECGRLSGARNCAILLINVLFASAWYKIANAGPAGTSFPKYQRFANTLAQLMQDEGLALQSKGLKNRDYYMFTYSILNFNFEMVFELLLLFAHREANHQNNYLPSAQKQLVWLDFGVENRSRKIKGGSCGIGLSLDETVCQRTNESCLAGADINRVGKFFYAHGSSRWRECPSCGCKSVYGAGSWDIFNKQQNPPLPIPLFETSVFERTDDEKKWEENLQLDSLECPSCGGKTFASSAPMIMQTLVKGIPTSFLEEIQRSAKVCLKEARHIILFGYQLPPDDVVWQEAFSESVRSRLGSEKEAYCSVVVGFKGEKHWMYKDELLKYVNSHNSPDELGPYGIGAIQNALAIFGENRVRAYTGGIPDVWGDAAEDEVKELLYPRWVDWSGTRVQEIYF